MRLEGKSCVITGAGSGIGEAMAIEFAAEGAAVLAIDVVADRVDAVVAEVRKAGVAAEGFVADVSLAGDVDAFVAAGLDAFGRIDVLCNNAGVMDRLMPVADLSLEMWRRVIGVNLDGPFYAARAVLPHMLDQGGGSIINVASVAALGAGKGGAAYTSSKHGLVGLTRSIAWQYGQRGIRCNALCPGNVETALGMGGDPHPDGVEQMLASLNVMPGRAAEPAEVARVACFLASDEASYVNGAVFAVDAGWSAY